VKNSNGNNLGTKKRVESLAENSFNISIEESNKSKENI